MIKLANTKNEKNQEKKKSYIKTPTGKITFSPSIVQKNKATKIKNQSKVKFDSSFINYRKKVWRDFASQSPDMKTCQKEIKHSWNSKSVILLF